MKRSENILIIICFIAISLTAQAVGGEEASGRGKTKFTKHFRETYFAITEKAEFSIEVLPDEKEHKIGKNVIGIVIHNKRDQDVEGAAINITAGGDGEKYTIKDKGDGLYTVSDLDLKRAGNWKLTINIRKKSDVDQASFVFPDVTKKFLPTGSYDLESLKQKQ